MPSFSVMMGRQLMLLALMGVGVVGAKARLVDEAGRATLSRILVKILMPCALYNAFLVERPTAAQMTGFLIAVAAGFALCLGSLLLAKLVYGKAPAAERPVLQHGILVNNVAYVGIPVIDGFYGAEGLLYLSGLFIPANIFMWVVGLVFFTGGGGKGALRRVLVQPVILALAAGLLCLLTGLRLPGFLGEAAVALGACTTPVSMLIIGGVLAGVPLRSVCSLRGFGYCLLRLVAIPLACLLVLWLAGAPAVLSGTVVVTAGMPMAVATAILATQYKADAALASRLVFLSTLLSMLTLPLLAVLVNALFAA